MILLLLTLPLFIVLLLTSYWLSSTLLFALFEWPSSSYSITYLFYITCRLRFINSCSTYFCNRRLLGGKKNSYWVLTFINRIRPAVVRYKTHPCGIGSSNNIRSINANKSSSRGNRIPKLLQNYYTSCIDTAVSSSSSLSKLSLL